MQQSLSKELARFAAQLEYDAIPPDVIDKAKACILHNIMASLSGARTSQGRATAHLIKNEEPRADGAAILVDGSRVSRTGAAFANSHFICITGRQDSYLLFTHPGCIVIPAALSTAEIENKNGKEFLEAVVAGYELHNRIADGFVPSTQARGFNSCNVYGVIGGAVSVAKLLEFNEDKMACTIAQAVDMAQGTLESARVGSRFSASHEPNAAGSASLAALIARDTDKYPDTALEGEAGLYYAFTGDNTGKLSHVFTGPDHIELSSILDGLGRQYKMLDVVFKPYPAPGYDNAVIDLMADLKQQYGISHEQINKVLVEVNWHENTFPSPAFPCKYLTGPNIGTTHYVTAYVCVKGFYPKYRKELEDNGQVPEVLDLMNRVKVEGSKDRSFFSPRITVTMQDGNTFTGELKGNEFKWGFTEEARRVEDMLEEIPLNRTRINEVVDMIAHIENVSSIRELAGLCCADK